MAENQSSVDFKGQCGEYSNKDGGHNSATGVGMQPGQAATVNGAPPSNCVVGNDSACVFSVELVNNAGFYKYKLNVDAQGPNSFFGGSFYLAFKDQSGDVYYLSIFSSRREQHTLSYNSDQPAIVAIYWSDYSFTVGDGKAQNSPKASFQVVSPASQDQ